MNRRSLLATLSVLLLGCASGSDGVDSRRSGAGPEIRILLREASSSPDARIAVRGAYRFLDLASGRTVRSGADFKGTAPTGRSLRLQADGALISVNGRIYPGALIIRSDGDTRELINVTGLESYLPGVLARELNTAFPPATLRAQAIASRTYALEAIERRPPDRVWDVADDSSSQVYSGLTGQADGPLRDAVSDTRGMVLSFAGRVLPAFFHSTCGGHTADQRDAFGGPVTLAPLAGVPCSFCQSSRFYRWKTRFPIDEVVAKLGLAGLPASAAPGRVGTGGRLLSIRFRTVPPVELSAAEVRRRLGPERFYSTRISAISVAGGELRIEGSGWGHGVGMCQMGAAGMAHAGASARDILAHYYPGADLVRLY